jgi:4-diphosphocytidyl-2-C-methyl-D-erythritol kinase
MIPASSITVSAFAKINLTLRVLGTRADDFHDVRTVLHTIDLSDRIVCTVRRGPLRLRCRTRAVPVDSTNLVWRAAEALWRASGRTGEPRDLSLTLTKRIPARAGLGGGSSDAAATLTALSRLWRIDLPPAELAQVAAGLGSDVPFFLCGGAALGVGRGDEVYPLPDLPPWWALIAVPPFGVSTADAYGWRDGDADGRAGRDAQPPLDPRVTRTWLGRLSALQHDLQAPVARRHPWIADTVTRLQGAGALLAGMSGSGSAVYGLFASRAGAHAARRRLPTRHTRALHVTRLLSRPAFARAAQPRAT